MLNTLLEERHKGNVTCIELCNMTDLVNAKANQQLSQGTK
jgi:hypothetical protein